MLILALHFSTSCFSFRKLETAFRTMSEKTRLNIFGGLHWWQEHHPTNAAVRPVSPSNSLEHVISAPWASVSHLQCEKKCSEWSLKFALPLQVFKVLSLQLNPEVTYDPTQRRGRFQNESHSRYLSLSFSYPVEPEVSSSGTCLGWTAISITRYWVCVLFLNSNHRHLNLTLLKPCYLIFLFYSARKDKLIFCPSFDKTFYLCFAEEAEVLICPS